MFTFRAAARVPMSVLSIHAPWSERPAPIISTSANDLMTEPTFAVQPAAWGKFDSYGCDWAINMSHAYKIAAIWQETFNDGDMMIWRVTPGGEPIRWVRVAGDGTCDTEEIADLVFG